MPSSLTSCGSEITGKTEKNNNMHIQVEYACIMKLFKPNLEGREGVCATNTNWELVPQQRSLTTGGFLLLEILGTTSKPAV